MIKFTKFPILSLFLTGVIALLLTSPRIAYADSIATLEEIQGEVLIKRIDAVPDAWEQVTESASLNNGDSVKTRDGSGVLVYGNQARFELSADTDVTVKEEPESQDIWLNLGSLQARVNKERVIKPFQVATPAAVSAVLGSVGDFSINEDYELVIDLQSGGLYVYNDELQLDFDVVGGQNVGVYYDPVNTRVTVENAVDSIADIDFTIWDEKKKGYTDYTVVPGETVVVNWVKGEFKKYDEEDPEIVGEGLDGLSILLSPTTEIENGGGQEV